MIDESKIEKARDIFLKNGVWKKIYAALTPGAKRWYDLTFAFSDAEKVDMDKDEISAAIDAYERNMSYDDLCCLLVHEKNGYMRTKLKKLIVAACGGLAVHHYVEAAREHFSVLRAEGLA